MVPDELESARRRIAAAIELGDSFQVIFVFGPSNVARDIVAQAVADGARTTQVPVNLLWFLPTNAAAPVEGSTAQDRTVWVVDCGEAERRVSEQLGELNRKRDSMAAHASTTLVILIPTSHGAAPARYAPDLWSVRTVSVSVDAKEQEPSLPAWESDCERAFEARLAEKPNYRERYSLGGYAFAYRVAPATGLRSLKELRDLMSRIGGWTGWRPWWVPTGTEAPYAAEDKVLECWMASNDQVFQDPAHSDFWRASPNGYFYLLRGYGEDSTDDLPPGKRFSLGLPVWRAGEALFHARQIAEALVEGFAEIEFRATWSGLRGRTTTEWPSPHWDDVGAQSTQQDVVSSSIATDTDEVRSDLDAVVFRLLRPLYDAFLAAPSEAFVRANIDDMRKRPVR